MQGSLYFAVVALLALALTTAHAQESSLAGKYIDTWVNEGAAGADAPDGVTQAKALAFGTEVLMFGGLDGTSTPSNLMHYYDSDTQSWRLEVYATGVTPSARYGHTMVSAPSNPNLVYVFSGCTTSSCDPVTSATGVAPFSSPYLTYDRTTKEWASINPSGTFVDGRVGAVMVPWVDTRSPTDPNSEYFVMYGGYSLTAAKRAKVYLFQVSSGQFSELPIVPAAANPPALADAAGLVIGNTFYLWGGHDYEGATYSNDLYALNLETNTWSLLSTAAAPSARAGVSFGVLDGTSLIIHGGYTSTVVMSETAVLNVTAPVPTWTTSLSSSGPRGGAAAAIVQGNLFEFGGLAGSPVRGSATVASVGHTYFTRPQVTSSLPAGGRTCAQSTVTVSGRQFANTGNQVCSFGGVTTAATFVSSTQMTCPAAIPNVVDSVSAVQLVVGNEPELLASAKDSVSYQYAEDQSSRTTTAAIGLPSAGVAGSEIAFQIQARAACGIERLTQYYDPPLTGTNDNITVVILDLGGTNQEYHRPVVFSTNPTEFGRYDVTFNTTSASSYLVEVFLNGERVTNVPTVVISPALPDAAAPATFVTQPASLTSTAGNTIAMTIDAVDQYGNVVTNPGLFTATATLDANTVLTGDLSLGSGSSIDVAFSSTTEAGLYNVVVRTAHNNAIISAFDVTIEPGPFVASASTASGFGVSIGRVAERNVIYVQPRDQYGNPAVVSGINFDIELLGSAAITGEVIENPTTGLYEASYTATAIGQYSVDISVAGVAISGSPFAVTIQVGSVQAVDRSIAFGSGLRSVVAGKKGFFVVQARDPYDNLVPFGGLNLTVTSEAIKSASINDRGDGSYTIEYEAKHLGHFGSQKICVTQAGVHVLGSPFTVDVEYGVVFFVIVFLAVLIASVLIAIACTWGFNKAHRRYRYKMLMRNPDKVFPTVEDEHLDENDPWVVDPDWAEGGVPLEDIGVDMANADGDFAVDDLVNDFHDDAPPALPASSDPAAAHVDGAMANISRT